MIRLLKILSLAALLSVSSNLAHAEVPFEVWLEKFKQRAIAEGISEQTVNQSFKGITPIERVIELDKKQPEGRLTFAQYKARVINNARIKQGRALLKKHSVALNEVSKKYGVQPQYIVALWGLETSYGKNTGGFSVVRALSTLAHEGRRASFFQKELLAALKIIDEGHITAKGMKGSWAGAMGQNQFMPTSFHAYAQDYDGDGRRDIWGTRKDVFASTANYLSRSGWKGDERWGRAIKLPPNFKLSDSGLKISKPLKTWRKQGVTLLNGASLPVAAGMKGSVVLPDGLEGDAFLVYDNYRVIMKWNRSIYFASTVGILADAIR